MNATKFLVYCKLINSPSVCFTFVSSFNVNIESLAHDFIPPKMSQIQIDSYSNN